LKIIEQSKYARKCLQYHYIKANLLVNQWFLKARSALRNAELTGFASLPFGSFGASRLANQTFDRQNLPYNQALRARYTGEPASQLGIIKPKQGWICE